MESDFHNLEVVGVHRVCGEGSHGGFSGLNEYKLDIEVQSATGKAPALDQSQPFSRGQYQEREKKGTG